MNKIYIFYLMCLGISLTFLTTYFSISFPDYSTSVFYIVNMMLVSSILLLMILEGRVKSFTNKLVILSSFFLLLYFSLVIVENVVVLTLFGKEVVSVFSIFFMMCAFTLMLIASLGLREEPVFNNMGMLSIIFSPVIIYSLWVLVNSSLTGSGLLEQTPLRLFIIAFSVCYSFIIFYNIFSVANKTVSLRSKYFIIALGLSIILLFSGFRQANLLFELSSLFSVIGGFTISFGLLIESSLEVHNRILSALADGLTGKKKQAFLKFLSRACSKHEGLRVRVDEGVKIFDNPFLSNIEEKQGYDKVLLSSYKWFRRNTRGRNRLLKRLKSFYNQQAFLNKRLNSFLI